MKQSTSRAIRAVLDADSTVRPDLRASALATLNERGNTDVLPILLTQAQAARVLSVSKSTLFRMVQAGDLCPVLIRGLRRYRREDLERIAGTAQS